MPGCELGESGCGGSRVAVALAARPRGHLHDGGHGVVEQPDDVGVVPVGSDIERSDAHRRLRVGEQGDKSVGIECVEPVGTAKASDTDRRIGVVEGGERCARIVEETRLGGGSASGHDLVVHGLTLRGPALAAG